MASDCSRSDGSSKYDFKYIRLADSHDWAYSVMFSVQGEKREGGTHRGGAWGDLLLERY